jgi:hypothetical protein
VSKRTNTPVIKPQPKVQFEQINFKIDTQTLEKLRAYSEFIDSEQGYIIREALTYLFESDSTFQEFFAARLKSASDSHATS